jgi:O-antigen/teichoic acid export membrane protein
MLATFAGLGFGVVVTKFVAEFRNSDPQRVGRILALTTVVTVLSSLMISVALACTAPWVATRMLAAPHLAAALRIGAALLFFTGVNTVQITALSGFESFKAAARINIICSLINFPLVLVGTYFGGLNGALWAWVCSAGANCLLTQVALRKECRQAGIIYCYKTFWRERGLLGRFSLPVFLSGLSGTCVEWALTTALVNQPGGYSQLGLFNAAKQWSILILYSPTTLSNVTFPILSNLLGNGQPGQFKKMIVHNSLLLAGTAIAVGVPVAIFSRYIMGIYGHGFAEGWLVLLAICGYSVLYASNIVVGQAIWTLNLIRAGVLLSFVRAAAMLLFWQFFAGKGAVGLALTYLFTHVLQTAYQIPYVWFNARALTSRPKKTEDLADLSGNTIVS